MGPDTVIQRGQGAAVGDHVAAGLVLGAAATWAATGTTGSLVAGLLTVLLLAAGTAVATFTAVAPPHAASWVRGLAMIAATVTTLAFVLVVDHAWALGIPTVTLAVGLRRPRARGPRVLALATSALLLVGSWVVGIA